MESSRTVSHQWHDDIVPLDALENVISNCIAAGEFADSAKKGLFYGNKTTVYLNDGSYSINPPKDQAQKDRIHAALGLFTEASELLENELKALKGEQFDAVNCLEECGDVEFYLAMLYRALRKTPEQAKALNIAKLQARYPDKFDSEKAINRDLGKERGILENG